MRLGLRYHSFLAHKHKSMEILYLIIPLSVLLIIAISWVFMWAVRSGQFDDLEGPAHRIIMEEDVIINNDDEENDEHEAEENNKT